MLASIARRNPQYQNQRTQLKAEESAHPSTFVRLARVNLLFAQMAQSSINPNRLLVIHAHQGTLARPVFRKNVKLIMYVTKP